MILCMLERDDPASQSFVSQLSTVIFLRQAFFSQISLVSFRHTRFASLICQFEFATFSHDAEHAYDVTTRNPTRSLRCTPDRLKQERLQ